MFHRVRHADNFSVLLDLNCCYIALPHTKKWMAFTEKKLFVDLKDEIWKHKKSKREPILGIAWKALKDLKYSLKPTMSTFIMVPFCYRYWISKIKTLRNAKIILFKKFRGYIIGNGTICFHKENIVYIKELLPRHIWYFSLYIWMIFAILAEGPIYDNPKGKNNILVRLILS